MKLLPLVLCAALLAPAPFAAAAAPAEGRLTGGVKYALPGWFKQSLLDLRLDVEEAKKAGRRVLLFLHLEECPYCERMLRENFRAGARRDAIAKHFDVIGIDVRGNQEVNWTDGRTFTERTLARHLKTFGTPTIVFLDDDGGVALKLSGYRDPGAFGQALAYVEGRHYRTQAFAAWAAAQKPAGAVYAFRRHPLFVERASLAGHDKPLAILFEDRACAQCARWHEKTLNHPDVLAELRRFLVVRLDADATTPIVTPEGEQTTPAQWAKTLGIGYRPALVLYNEGRIHYRTDGLLYHQHLRETLRWVGGALYRDYPSLSRYKQAYRAELLKKGVDINFAE